MPEAIGGAGLTKGPAVRVIKVPKPKAPAASPVPVLNIKANPVTLPSAAAPITTKQAYGVKISGTAKGPSGTALGRAQAGKPVTAKQQRQANQASKVADAVYAANKPKKSSGGGLPLGAIINPIAGAVHVPHVIAHLPAEALHVVKGIGQDAVALPKATAIGLEGLGKATVQTVEQELNPKTRFEAFSSPTGVFTSTPVGKQAQAMWHNSIPQEALEGRVGAVGKQFYDHPLNSILQVTPAGKLATIGGDIARAGALGEKAADYASTARADGELAPGIGRMNQHYSKNLVINRMQKAADANPEGFLANARRVGYAAIPTGEQLKAVGRVLHPTNKEIRAEGMARLRTIHSRNLLNARGDFRDAAGRGREIQAAEHLEQKFHDIGTRHEITPAEDKAVRYVVEGEVRNPATAHADLERIYAELRASAADPKLSPVDKAEVEAKLAGIGKLLESPNFDAHMKKLFAIKEELRPTFNTLEAHQAARGIYEHEQLLRRRMLPYAQRYQDAKFLTPEDNVLTHGAQSYRDADQYFKAAKRELTAAKIHINRYSHQGPHTPLDTAIKGQLRRLAAAQKNEGRTTGFIQGRFGGLSALGPQLGKVRAADRAYGAIDRSTREELRLNELTRQKIVERDAARKEAVDRLEAAKVQFKDAAAQRAALKREKGKRLTGWTIRDPADPTGQRYPLTSQAIAKHMLENEVGHPLYVRASRNFSDERVLSGSELPGRGLTRGDSNGPKFTGASLRTHTAKSGMSALRDSALYQIRRVENARRLDEMIAQDALVHGAPLKDAIEVKRQWEAENPGMKLAIMHSHARTLSQEKLDTINNLQDDAERSHQYDQQAAADREIGPDAVDRVDPEARVSLVPRVSVDRYTKHLNMGQSNDVVKFARRANVMFRNTVLPTSTKWILGNVTEAALRSVLVGAGPMDLKLAHDFLNSMDPEQRADFMAYIGEGEHFKSQDRLNYEALSAIRGDSAAAQSLVMSRNWKNVASLYGNYRKLIFRANSKIEGTAVQAVLGAHLKATLTELKQSGIFKDWGDAVDAQEKYLAALRDRVATPEGAQEAAERIHTVLGKYSGFSPAAKAYISTIAPFAPWYLNALKFIYFTMPKEHALVNAALLAEGTHNPNYVNSAPDGVSQFGTQFGDLTAALRTKPDQYVDIPHFLPQGAFTDSGPGGWAFDQILPGAMGATQAFASATNAFGEPIKGPDDKQIAPRSTAAVSSALNELLGSFVPAASLAERAMAGGATEYGTSTLWHVQPKKGQHRSLGAAVNRILNPVRATNLRPSDTPGSASSSGIGGSYGAGIGGSSASGIGGSYGKGIGG